jgi:quinoprotein dehydrogenase-associated probable ABC transporter substrate-binding protein/PQQ-dependent catabolism-associated CXXCW motif protein
MVWSGVGGRSGSAAMADARPWIWLAAAATLLIGLAPCWAQTVELGSRTELRVCADPNSLPFSNREKQGYENKIADLVGKQLNLPVTYTWFPQVAGFVRNTLQAQLCDLVMGTVTGDTIMDTTTPYYHSGYMLVTRTQDAITATAIGDPALADKRFGLIASTPPTDMLLRHGLLGHTKSYSLAVDTRYENPSRAMIQDLLDGRIDVALLWGPIAGYFIANEHLPLRGTFLATEPGSPRLDYHIAMGVRVNEPEWRRRINQIIHAQQPRITEILMEYGIPLLDERNQPIVPAVEEPADFRMDDYRAPVPATLRGAQVVNTDALKVMVEAGDAVLIDVLPAPRRPEGMQPGTPWMPVPRRDLPHSLWLPDVGRGAISPQMDAWFQQRLTQATAGDKEKMVVFYCLSQCWMSWNAGKRAITYGYRNVIWYPDGSDGWAAAGLDLAEAVPQTPPE